MRYIKCNTGCVACTMQYIVCNTGCIAYVFICTYVRTYARMKYIVCNTGCVAHMPHPYMPHPYMASFVFVAVCCSVLQCVAVCCTHASSIHSIIRIHHSFLRDMTFVYVCHDSFMHTRMYCAQALFYVT